MQILIDTPSYNERRYGRPYICKIVDGQRSWGRWTGRPGEEGELSIDADAGDLIAKGQKDNRKGGHSDDWYAVVLEDGSLEKHTALIDGIRAQKKMLEILDAAPPVDMRFHGITDADIIAELTRRGYSL